MWNQSSGGSSIGSLLQNLAQSNPQVFQAIMQMVSAQRQQGVGGIGSLAPPALPGFPRPMPSPLYRRGPDGTTPALPGFPRPMPSPFEVGAFYPPGLDRFPMPSGTNAPPAYSGQPPQGGMWSMGRQGQNPGMPAGTGAGLPGFNPGMRGDQGGRPAAPYRAPAYNPQPSGPKYMPQQPYAQPTGPKYMPPTGPKTYGQTMPAEAPPSFAQPKPFPQPAPPMAGEGTSGLDWYGMQAGN